MLLDSLSKHGYATHNVSQDMKMVIAFTLPLSSWFLSSLPSCRFILWSSNALMRAAYNIFGISPISLWFAFSMTLTPGTKVSVLSWVVTKWFSFEHFLTLATLKSIASYAQGVGPNKVKFTDVPESVAKERVAMAKDLNLSISPYTFRSVRFSFPPSFSSCHLLSQTRIYVCLSAVPYGSPSGGELSSLSSFTPCRLPISMAA